MVVFNLNKPDDNITFEFVYKLPGSNKYIYKDITCDIYDNSAITKVIKFLKSLPEDQYIFLGNVQNSYVLTSFTEVLNEKNVSEMIELFEIVEYIYTSSKFNLLETIVWLNTIYNKFGVNNKFDFVDYYKNNKYNTNYFVYSKSIKEQPIVWKSLQLQGITNDDVLNDRRNFVFLGQFFIDLIIQSDEIAISKLSKLNERYVRHKVIKKIPEIVDYIDKNNLPSDILFKPYDLVILQDELDTPELLFEVIDLYELGKFVQKEMDLMCVSYFYNDRELIQHIFEI